MNKRKTVTKVVDNNTLKIECDEEGGQYLDARAFFNESLLCWISFPDADQFAEELFAVISKHRI